MREGAKQRLIGAAAIVALVVIFVPMLFEREPLEGPVPAGNTLPIAPDLAPLPQPKETFLGPDAPVAGTLGDGGPTESQPLDLPTLGDSEPAPASANELPPPDAAQPGSTSAGPPTASDRTAKAEDEREEWSSPPAAPQPAAAAATPTPPRSVPAGMPSWVVQVASVATPDAAAELESKLRKGGFSAFVEKAEVNGKLYYRVRVGPEIDRARAERSASELRQRFKVDTLISGYP